MGSGRQSTRSLTTGGAQEARTPGRRVSQGHGGVGHAHRVGSRRGVESAHRMEYSEVLSATASRLSTRCGHMRGGGATTGIFGAASACFTTSTGNGIRPSSGTPSREPFLKAAGYPGGFRRERLSHADSSGVPRGRLLEHHLFACGELSGVIHSCGLVGPTGLDGIKPTSVTQKLKDRASPLRSAATTFGTAPRESDASVTSTSASSSRRCCRSLRTWACRCPAPRRPAAVAGQPQRRQ